MGAGPPGRAWSARFGSECRPLTGGASGPSMPVTLDLRTKHDKTGVVSKFKFDICLAVAIYLMKSFLVFALPPTRRLGI
jgi:hypothetical protein